MAFVGAHDVVYCERPDDAKPAGSHFDENTGSLAFEQGVMFKVGHSGATWKMVITLEESDTYHIYLLKTFTAKQIAKIGQLARLLAEADDVYADRLQETVEAVYRRALGDAW